MYKVIYDDDTIFIGGNLRQSRWKEINKNIKSLECNLTDRKILLSGYEKYNFLIEKAWVTSTNQQFVSAVYLLGLRYNKVDVIKIDCINKKITQSKKAFGKEISDSSTTGWKNGIRNNACGFEIQ